jgi:hypothetical protein
MTYKYYVPPRIFERMNNWLIPRGEREREKETPSHEANSRSASQDIPRLSCYPKVHYCVHKSPPPVLKGKGKIIPVLFSTEHHAMKAYWRSGGISPLILNLGTRCWWVVSFTPQPLYPQGKRRWYPLDRRLGGPQSRCGCCGKSKGKR